MTIGTGIECDGKSFGNEAQSDKLSASMSFYVEQSRNNEDFTCTPPPPECRYDGDCIDVELIEVIVDEGEEDLSINTFGNNHDDDDEEDGDDGDKGTVTYRFKITNKCDKGLSYIAFELPFGEEALEPDDESTYTAPSGNNYSVENTTNNPFHSIKFETLGPDGIKNGGMEEFSFVMPLDVPILDDRRIEAKFGQNKEQIRFDTDECELPEIPDDKDYDNW